ncbi:unnamed protein product [Ostreobium quekettii]|uniref:UBC core domain-containing protein n=1 Tax=Ostreobium quekettii TaxID=121088 RepID=A0A8S1IQQ6_9CHLO|nr:unnamed protein product [Ostreobium quekettii]
MSYPPMPFGYPSPAASGPDPRKKQQVDELLAQVPSCRPLNVDRTLLELPVQTREGRLLAVQISLPQRFPDEPPVLVVKQLFRHPVIDGNGRLQLPALQFWHPGHRLAAVVRDAQSALIGQPAPAGEI